MPDVPRPLPPKKDVALALLEGPSLFIHLDPRCDGVVVPKWFTKQYQLVLQVGLNMPVQIPDLTVDDDGISCTLSFNRTPFWCSIPWSAVYALVGDDGRGLVWPNDVPPEVTAQAQKSAAAPPPPPPPKAGRRAKPKLAAVKSGEAKPQRGGARAKALEERSPSDGENAERVRAAPEPAPEPDASEAPRKAPTPIRRPKNQGRSKLVAVPPPTSAAPPSAPERLVSVPREQSKGPAPRSAGPGDKKPKRELPPYLRVIK